MKPSTETPVTIDWVSRAQGLTLKVRNFIHGKWQDIGVDETIEKVSPRDGRILYRFGNASNTQVDSAVRSAREAYEDGRWRGLPVQHRKEILLKLANLVTRETDSLALLESLDVGKPIQDALTFDVPAAAETIRYCAEAADKVFGTVFAADERNLSYQQIRPLGVVAGIVGWNFPLVLAAQKLAPVLATGNSLILKPSELTSLSAGTLASLAIQAGVPEGVFNVIHGEREAGARLAEHAGVDALTFTGSTQTGKALLASAGRTNLKRVVLECGGKAANIVFEDCPSLDAVADGVVARAFWNQGQVCTASSRLLVQETVKEKLQNLILERVASLKPADPLRIDTRFGALVSRAHQQKVLGYVTGAEAEGAHTVYQGNAVPPFAEGFYVAPVIYDRVTPEQRIAQEEIFGPVLSIMSFSDEEQSVRLANSTMYGLSAIVWTRDMGRAHRMSCSLQAGWIVINACERPEGGPPIAALPSGGHKGSGMGVEGGIDGLREYTHRSAVQIFV